MIVRKPWSLFLALLTACSHDASGGDPSGGDHRPLGVEALFGDGSGRPSLDPGESLGANRYTLDFGSQARGGEGLAEHGLSIAETFAFPPGTSLRFVGKAAGSYDIAFKNECCVERVTEHLSSLVPDPASVMPDGRTFDGTAAWLGHSRFQRGLAPALGAESPGAPGTRANGSSGAADLGTAVRVDDSKLLPIPVLENRVHRQSFLISADVYVPRRPGLSHGMRAQPYIDRAGWGLSAPGGSGTFQLDLAAHAGRWTRIGIRADFVTDGGTLAGSADDRGQVTYRYFVAGQEAAAPTTLTFEASAMTAQSGPVRFSPHFGLRRGWQGDAAEAFLDNLSVTDIVADASSPNQSAFLLTSPAQDAVLQGVTSLGVQLGTLRDRVATVEYRVNDRTLFKDGEPVGPLPAPFRLDWHSAELLNGTHLLTAIGRDAAGAVVASTPPLRFRIANGASTVQLLAPDPAQPQSGTVDWTVQTNQPREGGNFAWYFLVDGVEHSIAFWPGTPVEGQLTVSLPTQRLLNGRHELTAIVRHEIEGTLRDLGMSQVHIYVRNGHTAMALQHDLAELRLQPSGSAQLVVQRHFTDDTLEPLEAGAASFSSSDEAVATVSASGLVSAIGPGTALITSRSGDLSGQTRVFVDTVTGFPHFTRDGRLVQTYGPDSLFVRTLFFSGPDEFEHGGRPDLAQKLQAAGVNALTTIMAWRRAYPYGASNKQVLDGIDHATLTRHHAYLPEGPRIVTASLAGPFYRKQGPGSHYTTGQDLLLQPGSTPSQVTAQIFHSIVRGAAGIRMYGLDYSGWKQQRAEPRTLAELQTGADAYEIGKGRWSAMASAFTLIGELEPLLLQAPIDAVSVGPQIVTGAKSGPNGRVLIAINSSELPRSVRVPLARYVQGGAITRHQLDAGARVSTSLPANTQVDSLTLQAGEVALWVFR